MSLLARISYSRHTADGRTSPRVGLFSVISAPPLHLLCTCAVPSPYLRRFMFGFRSEIRTCTRGGVKLVRRWYGEGAVEASRNKTSAKPTQTMQIDACSGVACRIAIKGCAALRINDAARRVATPSEKRENRV